MNSSITGFATIIFSFLVLGCTSGNCRQTSSTPAPSASGMPTAPPSAIAPGTKATATAPASATHVEVYKYDGSQQCGMGKSTPVEEMEKELKGIAVTAREKRPDGLMRIQVCGASTGMANVYTIPAGRLPDAEKRGFKAWSF